MRGRALFLAIIVGLACGSGSGASWADELQRLTIETASGPHVFSVEVMRTPDEQAKGLMFRRFLPADRGMLFDFAVEGPVAFWMKNTYIPLDMLFIDHTGRVVAIKENAEPLSETPIPSKGPALGVLELNGGEAAKDQVKVGDIVRHAMFGNGG